MSEFTTIQIDTNVLEELKEIKQHPRQSYNEIINKLVKTYKETEEYDKFLNEIQKERMKALWDNKYDEVWEKA